MFSAMHGYAHSDTFHHIMPKMRRIQSYPWLNFIANNKIFPTLFYP